MEIMEILGLLAGWVVCGIITAGIIVPCFRSKYRLIANEDYRSDLGFALLCGLLGGPVVLIISIFTSGFLEHGWTLLPPPLGKNRD